MRHGKKFNHLGRTASHRKAMLSNMASSLILNKRITTTVAKAKALRKYIEPIMTKAKNDSTHSRRVVFSYLQDKETVQLLFSEVADKIANRPGGYTRIIKMGNRLGDNADMCIIELVDYNELLSKETKPEKTKTRRSRRGGGSKSQKQQDSAPATAAAEKEIAAQETANDSNESVETGESSENTAAIEEEQQNMKMQEETQQGAENDENEDVADKEVDENDKEDTKKD